MQTQLAQLRKIGHYDVSQSTQTRVEQVKVTKACGSGEGSGSSTSSGRDSHSGGAAKIKVEAVVEVAAVMTVAAAVVATAWCHRWRHPVKITMDPSAMFCFTLFITRNNGCSNKKKM
eukprot:5869914-Ditylum_brightwellii.AAC.1